MKPRPDFPPLKFFASLLVFLFLGGFPANSNPGETGKVAPGKIAVDWNGDGSYDLLLGDQDGFVNLYLNERSNESPGTGPGLASRPGKGKSRCEVLRPPV